MSFYGATTVGNCNCFSGTPVVNKDGTCGCDNTQIILPKQPVGTTLDPATGLPVNTLTGSLITNFFSLHPLLSLGGAALVVFLLLKLFKK